ncbi:MAG: 7-cyano-7-deazaguanine synthase [Pirellulaceae bacterium]
MSAKLHAVLSASGGMDSTSLLLHFLAAEYHVHLVSFRYGQKHVLELDFLRRNLEYLRTHGYELEWHVVDLAGVAPLFHSALIEGGEAVPVGHYEQDNMRATVVPNRNAIFASIAYAWALSLAQKNNSTVKFGLGVHSGDHAIYPDCRPEFFGKLLDAFAAGNWDSERVEAYLPYLHGDKASILRDAVTNCDKLELDFDRIFANTLTSYSPGADGRSAGLTGSDVERILAFDEIGRIDPLPYEHSWEIVLAQAKKLRDDFVGSSSADRGT